MLWYFPVFVAVLIFFHASEFSLACLYMREQLGWSSWLVSKPYAIAMGIAVTEYWLEMWSMPSMKTKASWIAILGLGLVVTGELIRKTGMLTAQRSFTHIIRRERHPDHRLVVWGIYRFIRHPGYLGWYIWAVGTQVLLVNPVSTIIFALVSWRFFNQRIQYEEYHLRHLFPEYEAYAARTPTWIPFIN